MTEHIPSNENSTPRDIDEAIHQCIVALENDDESMIQELISGCPQWKGELEEFLTNWGGMEQVAEQIGSGRETVIENESGNQIGDYELIEQIGSGGMGVIYKAHQLSLDRMVALKMIHRNQTDRERFQVEAEAIAALTHSNIVQVYEIGEHQGRLFFSMQLIEGSNLKEYRKNNKVSPSDAATITKSVALAVHYAHQRGILHRDLKPANVLMDAEGQPHITDFGLAKQMGRDNELTVSGAIIGTPAYMAPEQAAGQAKNLTVATDVYGLGAILYALITGQAPFTGESSLEIIRKVVDQPPSSPRIHNNEVGRDLETICLKCLEKAPELRYASAAELADDLQLFLSGQPVNARPVPQLERVWRWCVRNPIVSALTIAVVLLLISTSITAIFLAMSERNARIMSERQDREKKSLELDYEQEKRKKQIALELAEQSKTNLFLSKGQWNLLDGNLPVALLWYSHVANRLRPDPSAYEKNLARCKSIFKNVAVPIHAIQLNADYHDIAWGFQDCVELDSRGNRALIQVGEKFYVWDCSSGKASLLNQTLPEMTCAKFCSFADRILVGCRDNKFVFVDASTLQVEREFEVGGCVTEVSVSANGKLVAVSFGNSIAVWDAELEHFIDSQLQFDSNVEHVKFNEQASRAIVVYQDNNGKSDKTGRLAAYAKLLAIDPSGISEVSKMPCRILKRQHFRYPYRRPFWPVFVQGDQSIMVRNEGTRIHFYDANDGKIIRFFYSQTTDFTYTASRYGEYYATGKLGMASIRRVLHSPPTVDQPNKRKEFMRLIHEGQVVEAIISPNNLVASCNIAGVIKLWHIHKSQFSRPCDDSPRVFDQTECLCEIPHQGVVRRMVFSDEGSQLMTVQNDGLVRIWSLPDYSEHTQEIEVARGGALARSVSDNEWMICGLSKWTGRVDNVRSFDAISGRRIGGTQLPEPRDQSHLLDADVSPDSSIMITLHSGDSRSKVAMARKEATPGFVQFWSYPDGNALSPQIPMIAEPRCVSFHPTENRVAVVDMNMDVFLFDTVSFELVKTLRADNIQSTGAVAAPDLPLEKYNGRVLFHPAGDQLMAWGIGSNLFVWNPENESLLFKIESDSGQRVEWAEYSPEGNTIALALGRSGIVRTVDAQTGQRVGPDLAHDSMVVSARFNGDGRSLITAAHDGRARIFDWRNGSQSESGIRHNSQLVDACFTPNSEYAVTLDNDRNLYVWSTQSGELAMPPIKTAPGACQLLVSSDSKRLLVGGGLRRMMIVRLDQLYENSSPEPLEFLNLSQLISGKNLNNKSTTTLTSLEWMNLWNTRDRFDRKSIKF